MGQDEAAGEAEKEQDAWFSAYLQRSEEAERKKQPRKRAGGLKQLSEEGIAGQGRFRFGRNGDGPGGPRKAVALQWSALQEKQYRRARFPPRGATAAAAGQALGSSRRRRLLALLTRMRTEENAANVTLEALSEKSGRLGTGAAEKSLDDMLADGTRHQLFSLGHEEKEARMAYLGERRHRQVMHRKRQPPPKHGDEAPTADHMRRQRRLQYAAPKPRVCAPATPASPAERPGRGRSRAPSPRHAQAEAKQQAKEQAEQRAEEKAEQQAEEQAREQGGEQAGEQTGREETEELTQEKECKVPTRSEMASKSKVASLRLKAGKKDDRAPEVRSIADLQLLSLDIRVGESGGAGAGPQRLIPSPPRSALGNTKERHDKVLFASERVKNNKFMAAAVLEDGELERHNADATADAGAHTFSKTRVRGNNNGGEYENSREAHLALEAPALTTSAASASKAGFKAGASPLVANKSLVAKSLHKFASQEWMLATALPETLQFDLLDCAVTC